VIAVAVADRPEGPFRDALGHPLVGPQDGFIDPTVFVDSDGQAYLYWGNPNLWYVKLNRDMVSYSGKIEKIEPRLKDYQEGPWFFKHKDKYYMAFASTCCSEGIGYAMSDHPTGPWTYKGDIMEHNSASTGNHPGIIDYKGASYVFGFSYELNFALTPIHHERRSVNVAKFEYNADGTIPNLGWWNRTSAPQIEPLNPYAQVEAETIAWTSWIKRDRDRPFYWAPGVTTEKSDTVGVYVTRITDRSYIKVAGVDFGSRGLPASAPKSPAPTVAA
jgi:beta-xylosidase